MIASRYDFMSAGSTLDHKTNSYFPDPLTLNYGSFNLVSRPSQETLTGEAINYFWRTYMDRYGSRDYEDVVLTLNGVSHKNFLEERDIIYYPDTQDIKKSFSKIGRF